MAYEVDFKKRAHPAKTGNALVMARRTGTSLQFLPPTTCSEMKILKEGASFGVAGLIQLAIDWLMFVGLTKLGLIAAPANVAGRVSGALVGFWLNGAFTFKGEAKARVGRDHFGRFVVWWLITTLISTAAVTAIAHFVNLPAAWAAKPFIDVFLAGCSFFVSKYWIYR